jgi:hypothetical protein
VGFLSSSDRRVHFGLGAEASVASVEVRWPSGNMTIRKDVPADKILAIAEAIQ